MTEIFKPSVGRSGSPTDGASAPVFPNRDVEPGRLAYVAGLAEAAELAHKLDTYSVSKEVAGAELAAMTERHRAAKAAAEAPIDANPAITPMGVNPESHPINRYAVGARRARASSGHARAAVLEAMERQARAIDDNIRFLSRGRR